MRRTAPIRGRWRAPGVLAATVALAALACSRTGAPAPVVRPPAVQPPGLESVPEAPVPESPAPGPSPLELADALFEAGDVEGAAAAYEEHLASASPDGAPRALFRLGLLLVTPDRPVSDAARGRALLRTLLRDYPESAYRAPAEYLLALQGETEELRRQLEEIKRIDLEDGG